MKDLLLSSPFMSDCHRVGSLDFNFLGHQGFSIEPGKKNSFLQRGQQQPSGGLARWAQEPFRVFRADKSKLADEGSWLFAGGRGQKEMQGASAERDAPHQKTEPRQTLWGHFPILSRDPSFQKTIRTPKETAGF